jgi:hypothetical protein
MICKRLFVPIVFTVLLLLLAYDIMNNMTASALASELVWKFVPQVNWILPAPLLHPFWHMISVKPILLAFREQTLKRSLMS